MSSISARRRSLQSFYQYGKMVHYLALETNRGMRRKRLSTRIKLTQARITKASVPEPGERLMSNQLSEALDKKNASRSPPDKACVRHCLNVSSSTTGCPLSLHTIFFAPLSRSWWFASATRFSNDIIARLGLKRIPFASSFRGGVGGMLAGVTDPEVWGVKYPVPSFNLSMRVKGRVRIWESSGVLLSTSSFCMKNRWSQEPKDDALI